MYAQASQYGCGGTASLERGRESGFDRRSRNERDEHQAIASEEDEHRSRASRAEDPRWPPSVRSAVAAMVKVIATPPACCCSICSRAKLAPLLPVTASLVYPARPSSTLREGPGACSTQASTVASTSSEPYQVPAACRLPDELLLAIFDLARPPLPPVATRRHPLPPAWRSYLQLCLVHRTWVHSARDSVAKCVIVRTRRQMRALSNALEHGAVGGKVEELLLELKETESGAEEGAAGATCDAVARTSKVDADQGEADLEVLRLLRACGPDLKALRLRGFGDPTLVTLPSSIKPFLSSLELIEYSPVDYAYPPSTVGLMCGLSGLPKLKHLILDPSTRYLTPLRDLPEMFMGPLTRLVEALPAVLADDSHRTLYADAFNDETHMQHLSSLTLHSLALTPLTLLGLVFSSFGTLTSLSLSSTFFSGPASTLFNLLSLLAPQLESLEWEDKLINPVATLATPVLRRLGQSTLPADEYWSLLSKCKKLKKLKLFSEHVFSSFHRSTFDLPPDLEDLSVGRRGSLEGADVEWWIERIEDLLDSKVTHYEMESADDSTEMDLEVEEEGEEREHTERADRTAKSGTALADGADLLKRAASPPTSPQLSVSITPPFSISTPPLARTTPSEKSGSSRPRLSWRHPPSASPPPQLRRFSLCTTDVTLRADEDLHDKIDDLVQRGVKVQFWNLQVVMLETLELTRDLRVDMLQTGEDYDGL
ncbi:hypothetical protein JCM1841_002370 [Sporobolomyces salmonicolor]